MGGSNSNRRLGIAAVVTIAILLIAGAIAFFLVTLSAQKRDLILIGFVGELSGRGADLGISGRDGAILAVEQQNLAGGINGREIRLIIRDDQHDPQIAARVDNELIDEGVVAIIGHMTSAMSIVGVKIANERGVLMVSPTANTNELSGMDDNFFRINASIVELSRQMARNVYESKELCKTFIIYDVNNLAFTSDGMAGYCSEYEALGGQVVGTAEFASGSGVNFTELASKVVAAKPDCLFLLSNAMDTAMVCQQLAKTTFSVQVVTSEWSATNQLLQFGGRAVEELFALSAIDRTCQIPKYLRFIEAFRKRFNREPGFASCLSYDATRIVLDALAQNDDPATLKSTLLKIRTFQGLQSEIRFDDNGDATRKLFPLTIRDGRFVAKE